MTGTCVESKITILYLGLSSLHIRSDYDTLDIYWVFILEYVGRDKNAVRGHRLMSSVGDSEHECPKAGRVCGGGRESERPP